MKLINLNTNALITILAAIAITASAAIQADGNPKRLEDSMRHQIFLELKTNVNHLYLYGSQSLTKIDTSISTRVVSANNNSIYILPLKNTVIGKDERENET